MSIESTGPRVAGCGYFVPKERFPNDRFAEVYGLETDDAWIRSHTGVEERRRANPKMATSHMATIAARRALKDAHAKGGQVELIIVASVTGDFRLPATATIVQDRLGAEHAAAFDINAGCTGFLYGFSLATGMIESGRYRNALVIGAEKLSSILNYKDRTTCVLFGDGAGAVYLTRSTGPVTRFAIHLGADGRDPSLLWTPAGGSRNPLDTDKLLAGEHTVHMKGSELGRQAVRKMSESIDKVVEETGVDINNVKVVPHQANLRMIEDLMRKKGLTRAQVIINIQRYGNTSAASIPIALAEADLKGRHQPNVLDAIKQNDYLVWVGFGAGLTWGAVALPWRESIQEPSYISLLGKLRRIFAIPFQIVPLDRLGGRF